VPKRSIIRAPDVGILVAGCHSGIDRELCGQETAGGEKNARRAAYSVDRQNLMTEKET
jgi:hypothetical protein